MFRADVLSHHRLSDLATCGVRNLNLFEIPRIDEAVNYEFAIDGPHLR